MTPAGKVEAMFPLGTVLLPGAQLPLRVFEPRYVALMRDCVRYGTGFGVVLIERGSEVGGGDERADVGCRARLVVAEEGADGEWAVLASGDERIRINSWRDDDPYPRAEVEPWPDSPDEVVDGAVVDGLTHRIDRLVELAVALGRAGEDTRIVLDPDPVVATWQAAALGPLGAADRYSVLCCESPVERAALTGDLLDDQIELYAAELDFGSG